MIFADTSALYAVLVTRDGNHRAAITWIRSHKREARFFTTDYVISELLTLLRARGELQLARITASALFDGKAARIEHVGEVDIRKAATVFDHFADKEWSFTDCVSKVVMERLGVTKAFSFDDDFRQFGNIEVVP